MPLFLTVGCDSKTVAAAPQMPPPVVGVAEVVQKDVPVYGDWIASLDGNVNADIRPQVSGYLVKQNYREGSFVHKDDVLFEIDPRPFQAVLDQSKAQLAQAKGQLAQAQAQLALAEINVKRDTPLAAAHAIAQSQLDNDIQTQAQNRAAVETGQAAIEAAEAAIETAALNLGFTKVRSLVDGIAGVATTQVGNLVSQTTTLTTVSQVDPIKVYFPISEQEYLQLAARIKAKSGVDLLRAGSSVPLQLTLANGEKYGREGHMIFADRQVNVQTGTINIVGIFPNPGNILRPGQFARIQALTSLHKGALLVPQRAVTEMQGRYLIAVVNKNNKVNIRPVKVGERLGSLWVVESGVELGDRVVSEGTSKVQDGVTVNPQPESSPTRESSESASSEGN